MAEGFSDIVKQRLEDRKIEQQQFEEQKKVLEEMKLQLEAAGLKAEDSKKYMKQSYELDKKMLKSRLAGADSPSAKKEIKEEQKALQKKNQSLLGKIGQGITTIGDNMKERAKKAGKGLMAMVKGTLIAGMIVALLAFLESDTWKNIKEKIVEFTPKLVNFYNKTIKPFVDNIASFIANPSWKGFTNLFAGVENKGSLVAGLVGITALLAPGTLFTALKVGVKAFASAISLVGSRLPGLAPVAKKATTGAAKVGMGGLKAAKSVGKSLLSGAGKFARFLGPVGVAVAAGATIYNGISEGMEAYKKTGKVSEGIKTGAAAALKTLTFGLVSTETFKAGFDYIGEKTTALISGTKDMAKQAWDGMKNAIPTKETITKAYNSMKDKAVAVTESVGTFAKNAWSGIKNLIPTKESITTAYTGMKDKALAVTEKVGDVASKAWTTVKAAIPTEEDLKKGFEKLKTGLTPLKNLTLPTDVSFTAIKDAIGTNAKALSDSFKNLTGIDVSATIGKVGDKVSATAKKLTKSFENITGMTLPTFDEVKKGITDLGTNLKNKFTDITGIKIPSLTDIGTKLKAILPNISNPFSGILESIKKSTFFADAKRDGFSLGSPMASVKGILLNAFESIFTPRMLGGSVMAGQTYMVGERGPEFFRPSRGGQILNAQRTDAMRDAMLRRSTSGIGGGGQAVIAPTNVANTSNTSITHTTTSIVNPDQVVSQINKAA